MITNAFLLRPAVPTDLASPYPGDALTNLGTLTEDGITFIPSVTLTEARDTDEDGWIVGWGQSRTSSSTTRGFLLIPIDPTECEAPEEGTDADTDGDTTTAANLCDFGAATVAPLMLVGICLVRPTTGRRLSRRG